MLPPLTMVTAYICPPSGSTAFLVDFDEGFVRRLASHFAVNVDAPCAGWGEARAATAVRAVAARIAVSTSGSSVEPASGA
jgi:hypothetical protein